MMERIILTTGGTGGHIFPAMSVAEELQQRFPGVAILFLGGNRGPEGRIAKEGNIPFKGLPARGVLGKGFSSMTSVFWMTRSALKSWSILRSFRPDVVLGLGGYAGFIPAWVATLMKIPTAIHEQNSIPGVTNRILGKRVDRILLSYPDDHDFFNQSKVVVTGNPVRKSIIALRNGNETMRSGIKKLLILGGSQGAKAINDSVIHALPSMCSQNIRIHHQTGEADYPRVREVYSKFERCMERVEPFIEDMAEAYGWADLVIGRAGASTIAELTTIGKPSILIPFPYATHDHQLNNAKQLEAAGAAMILVQSYLEEINLARAVDDLFSMPGKLQEMSKAARSLGKPEAAANIVDELEKLSRNKKS